MLGVIVATNGDAPARKGGCVVMGIFGVVTNSPSRTVDAGIVAEADRHVVVPVKGLSLVDDFHGLCYLMVKSQACGKIWLGCILSEESQNAAG